MALFPFEVHEAPNPIAVFTNLSVISAVYTGDEAILQQFAAATDTTLAVYRNYPWLTAPGFAVFRGVNECLIAISGTVILNGNQWILHAAGSIVPIPDLNADRLCNLSFFQASIKLRPLILAALGNLTNMRIRITGHSYGAAVAQVLGCYFWTNHPEAATVEVQTFGGPRVYVKAPDVNFSVNQRIVNPDDPVPFSPPRFALFFGLGRLLSTTKLVGTLAWEHFGEQFQAEPTSYQPYAPTVDNLLTDALNIGRAFFTVSKHEIVPGYLPDALRILGTPPPQLQFLAEWALGWTPPPVIPSPYPAATPQETSIGWFGNDSTITEQNQPWWSVVSAQGYFALSGGSDMTRMKATMQFNFDGGGFSETLWAVNDSMTYNAMNSRIEGLLPLRAKLSEGLKKDATVNNPVTVFAFQIEDTLQNRDGYTTIKNQIMKGYSGYFTGPAGATNFPNISAPMAAKWTVFGAGARQKVGIYFHGTPLNAIDGAIDPYTTGFRGFQRYEPDLTASYINSVYRYLDAVATAGLGYRYLNSPWDINGKPGPQAIPSALAITTAPARQGYSFTMPQAFPTGQQWPAAYTVGQIFPFVIRGMKALNFLNGRKPVLITGPATGIILGRYPTATWDTQGSISPEIWGFFSPRASVTPLDGAPPGGQFDFVGPKKLGRPFGQQVGKRRTKKA